MRELSIYLTGVVLTWIYVGLATGYEFRKLKETSAPNIQINWVGVFFQGLAWPAVYASLLAEVYCIQMKKHWVGKAQKELKQQIEDFQK